MSNAYSPEVIPAILPKSFEELEEKVAIVEEYVSTLHLDICDGTLTKEESWNITEGEESELPFRSEVEYQVHLMMKDPLSVVDDWARLGARDVVVHAEADLLNISDLKSLGYGLNFGLAVNLDTKIESVIDLIPEFDFVHLMSIREIGKQGEVFQEETFAKIEELRAEFPEVLISVDGGVKLSNAKKLLNKGVDILVVGSAIIKASDPKREVEKFLKLTNETYR